MCKMTDSDRSFVAMAIRVSSDWRISNWPPQTVEDAVQSVRRRSPGLDRVATSAGATDRTFAATTTPATSTQTSQTGTTETGTAPRLSANAFHVARPATTPRGTPTTIPTRASVVACQLTAEATWRFTNPSTFKSPTSRRRRETLTASR